MCCLFRLYRKILPIQYMEKSFILCITEKVFGGEKRHKNILQKNRKNSCNLHKTHVYYYLLWHDSYEA